MYLLGIYFTSPPIWRVAANILNKQFRTVDNGCFSRLRILSQKRDRWQTLVNAVMNFRVS